MIKVKLTKNGGYVYGDGAIPDGMDADTFFKRLQERILRARLEGISKFVVDELVEQLNEEVDDAPVLEIKNTKQLAKAIHNRYTR